MRHFPNHAPGQLLSRPSRQWPANRQGNRESIGAGVDRACHARRYVAAPGTDFRCISVCCRRPPPQIARPWPRAEPKTRACFYLTQAPASGPRPGSGIARSRRFPGGTLAAGCYACSTSPGHPEPENVVLFVRLVVVAIRRTRVPSIIVEGTAPPHVMTAFRVLATSPLKIRLFERPAASPGHETVGSPALSPSPFRAPRVGSGPRGQKSNFKWGSS